MVAPVERHDRVLQGVSSVLLNSATTHGIQALNDNNTSPKLHVSERVLKKVGEGQDEIIPDSEEERIHRYTSNNRKYTIIDPNIIEISSEEEDVDSLSNSKDLFLAKVPGAWPTDKTNLNEAKIDPKKLSRILSPSSPTTPVKPKRYNRARLIIESSSSDSSSDSEGIIKMIGGFPEQSSVYKDPKASKKPDVSPPENQDVQVPLITELDDIWDSGSAILTLNEPKSARKPIHYKSPKPKNVTINTPFQISSPIFNEETRATPNDTPSRSRLAEGVPTTPKLNLSPRKTRQPPHSSKKAKAAAEQAEREAYAQKLFTELNHVVFKNGLPKETKLNWNKRLLTTAGRAKWHRSRDGTQITEIELAEKILDCEERIRNTLSHEMCHLASWLIDDNPKEVHGRLWKAWANRVMRKRPEIEITTRHNYEISYPFEWKCEKCAKIYGRFSNSIRTEECVCGSCKVGKLLPLFLTHSRMPKTPKTSRMAAMKSQDSPHSIPQSSDTSHRVIEKDGVIFSSRGSTEVYIVRDSDSESDPDVEDLSKAMQFVTIDTPDA